MDCVLPKCLVGSVPTPTRFPSPPCCAEEGDSRDSVDLVPSTILLNEIPNTSVF